MVQLDGMVVQLVEAKRFAELPDPHHQRLALLTLDNASEISLRRSAHAVTSFAELYNNAKRVLTSSARPLGAEGQALLDDIENETVSNTLSKRIDRDYVALVDFVASRAPESLADGHAQCLKIIHRFRNAAYHRDEIRPGVIGPAVKIMFFLCCHLLRNERSGIAHELGAVPPFTRQLLQALVPDLEQRSHDSAVGLAQTVADALLTDLELDHAGINAALSAHLIGRLDQLESDLDEIAAFGVPVTREVMLRFVQQAPSTAEQLEAPLPDDFWTKPLPVSASTIDGWRSEATTIADLRDARQALTVFSEVDLALEALEAPVERFVTDMDHEVQEAIDIARGK